jgi:hypothetical protein
VWEQFVQGAALLSERSVICKSRMRAGRRFDLRRSTITAPQSPENYSSF